MHVLRSQTSRPLNVEMFLDHLPLLALIISHMLPVAMALQNLFSEMCLSADQATLSPDEFVAAIQTCLSLTFRQRAQQQDVHEFGVYMSDLLERAFKYTRQGDMSERIVELSLSFHDVSIGIAIHFKVLRTDLYVCVCADCFASTQCPTRHGSTLMGRAAVHAS